MLAVVEQHIISEFTIDKNVNDPVGHTYVKGSVFRYVDKNFIEMTIGGFVRKINTFIQTNTFQNPLDSTQYLNYIRCAAGISYVTYNDITPTNTKLGLGFIERHSILKVISSTEIDKINYWPNGLSTSTRITVENASNGYVPLTAELLLNHVRHMDTGITNIINTKPSKQNSMAYVSPSLTSAPAPFNTMPVTLYTCKNPVTDMKGKTWTMQTTFKKVASYEVEATTYDANGASHSIVMKLNPSPTAPSYPTAEEYISDIMARDGAIMIGGVSGSTTGVLSVPRFVDGYADSYDNSTETPVDPPEAKTPIKKVYCPYNADLIVYDVHNKRVDELCGILTEEKFYALIKRINDDTKFDGFEYFKCAACELGAIKEGPQIENDFDALDAMKDAAEKADIKHIKGTFINSDGGNYSDSDGDPEEYPDPEPPNNNPFNRSKTNNYSWAGTSNSQLSQKGSYSNTKKAPKGPLKTKYSNEIIDDGDILSTDRLPANGSAMSNFEKAIAAVVSEKELWKMPSEEDSNGKIDNRYFNPYDWGTKKVQGKNK